MTTGKTIASTRRTFFGKVMSLLFNAAERSYPRSEARAASWRSNPMTRERWLHRRRRA